MVEVSRLMHISGKKFAPGFSPDDYRPFIKGLSDTTSTDVARLCTDPDYFFDVLVGKIYRLTSTCAAYQSGAFDNTDINYGGIVAELGKYCVLLANAFDATDTGALLAIADYIIANNM